MLLDAKEDGILLLLRVVVVGVCIAFSFGLINVRMYAQREENATRDSKYVADGCRGGGCGCGVGRRKMWYEMRDGVSYMCVYIEMASRVRRISVHPMLHLSSSFFKANSLRFLISSASLILIKL